MTLMLAVGLLGLLVIQNVSAEATLSTTDEFGTPVYDFDPGSIVYIHGSSFTPGNTIQISITRPDGVVETAPGYRFPSTLPTVKEDGTFNYTYDLDGIYGLYIINADDSVVTAKATFTDAKWVQFTQNGISTNPGSATIVSYANAGGTVSGNLNYAQLVAVTQVGGFLNYDTIYITATAPSGYTFSGWTGDASWNIDDAASAVTHFHNNNNNGILTANFAVSTVSMTVSYQIIGGGSPTAPTFNYVQGGTSKTYALTTTPTAISVDDGSSWSVTPNPLTGSTSSERWYSISTLNGAASASTKVFTFYHQYTMCLSYSVNDASTPSPLPQFSITSFGSLATGTLDTMPACYWGDAGGSWSVSDPIPASPTTERWKLNQDTSGTVSHTTIVFAYKHQYKVTFSVYGIDSDAGTHTVLTFDGNPCVWDSLPSNVWVDTGTTFSWASTVSGGANKRFTKDSQSGFSPITHGGTYSATYSIEYRVTFTATGLDSDAGTNTVLTLDGHPLAWDELPSGIWVDPGTTFSWANTVSGGANKQFIKQSQSGSSPITHGGTYSATYTIQYRVTFTATGLDGDAGTNTVLTLVGTHLAWDELPSGIWVNPGTTFSWENTVSGGGSKQFVKIGQSGSSPITHGGTYSATYKTQYRQIFQSSGLSGDATDGLARLTITPPGSTTTMHVTSDSIWVDEGSTVSFLFKNTVTSSITDKQYRLDHHDWIGANPYTVSGTNTITGFYVVQWMQYFMSSGLSGDATDGLAQLTITPPGSTTNMHVTSDSIWVDAGATVGFVFKDPVSSSTTDKRYRFIDDDWSGDNPYTVSGTNTITGTYIAQYKLTFKQSGLGSDATGWILKIDVGNNGGTPDHTKYYAGLSGAGFSFWVDVSTDISYTYQSPVTSNLLNTQYWLQSITGSASVFEVTEPETIIGNYIKLPYSAVTAGGCLFDKDKNTVGQQFNLLFTRDITDLTKYILTASNPGQFFYNTFYIGTPGTTVDIQLIIPSPFVTQGAVPIHIYSGVSVTSCDGFDCFSPYDEIANRALDPGTGGTITIDDIPVPDSGLVYVRIHLDYGWKKHTGYNVGTANLADNSVNTYDIPNLYSYIFQYTISGVTQPGSPTIQNINIFKNDPGFFGIVTVSGEPVQGVKITIKDSAGRTLGTATTDENGYYLFYYKYTGKEAKFTIAITSGLPTGVTYPPPVIVALKSNKYIYVPFEL